MSEKIIYLDVLLGRKVFDVDGQCAGRIEEVIARHYGDRCVIEEFLLGRVGLLERLSIVHFAHRLISYLGAINHTASHRIASDQMDLQNPKRPRLRCKISALKKIV